MVDNSAVPVAVLEAKSKPLPVSAAARVDPRKAPPAVIAPAVSPVVPPSQAVAPKEAIRAAARIITGEGGDPSSFTGGWAWHLDGHLARTTSVSSGLTAYYRRSQSEPYLIQSGGKMYVYAAGGRVQMFDQGGQPHLPTVQQRREAARLLADARRGYQLATR
jgi:hypothetical protein